MFTAACNLVTRNLILLNNNDHLSCFRNTHLNDFWNFNLCSFLNNLSLRYSCGFEKISCLLSFIVLFLFNFALKILISTIFLILLINCILESNDRNLKWQSILIKIKCRVAICFAHLINLLATLTKLIFKKSIHLPLLHKWL